METTGLQKVKPYLETPTFTQPSWMLMKNTELKNLPDFGLTILSLDTETLTGATKLIN